MEKLLGTLVQGLVGGRALTADETRTLEWLDGWEKSTVQNVLNLLKAAHDAGYERGKMAGVLERQTEEIKDGEHQHHCSLRTPTHDIELTVYANRKLTDQEVKPIAIRQAIQHEKEVWGREVTAAEIEFISSRYDGDFSDFGR